MERLASDVVELSTRQNFPHWLVQGCILRGWARSASGNAEEGISCIEDGIREVRANGAILAMPRWLALKAEALYLANRISEALAAIKEADALVAKYELRYVGSELHRLRGVCLAAVGADEMQIEDSFLAAISIANEQKSVSLAKQAGETYAEYRRQKEISLGGHGFRLPLW